MRGGATLHATRISQDVLTNTTNLPWSAKNPDIDIIANLWSVTSRHIDDMNYLLYIAAERPAALLNEWQDNTQAII